MSRGPNEGPRADVSARPRTLGRLAERAAQRDPDALAARFGDASLTWGELARSAHQLAGELLGRGLARGDRVGVLVARGLNVPVAFHGVLAAGGALVPIDPRSPARQAARILGSTGARFLVTEPGRGRLVDATLAELAAAQARPLEAVVGLAPGSAGSVPCIPWESVAERPGQPPAFRLDPADTAYVLHTSGSTGQPKLIRHTHASALSFVDWAVGEYSVRPDDRLSNHSSHHTCFATFDYYAAARAGAATILLPPAALMMPASLAELLERERVSIWYSVPTALVQLGLRGALDTRDLSPLRWVLFAGETFPDKHLRSLREQLAGARFSHVYGSTEVNVCTVYHLPEDGPVSQPLPIGVACSNTGTEVVDDALRAVEDGAEGELLVRGGTLMSGYWEDPERNRRVLVELPDGSGGAATYFRTGDRVRRLSDGNLAFVARADLQIKVRGFRVELGEVETALLSLDGVDEAAAVAVPDGEGSQAIRAAVVLGAGITATARELRARLETALPPQALPERILPLEALPRTPTGKTDRNALRERLLN